VTGYELRVSRCGERGAPLKERYALGALRLMSVPSELKAFLGPRRKNGIFDKRSALQVKRSSSVALLRQRILRVAGYGQSANRMEHSAWRKRNERVPSFSLPASSLPGLPAFRSKLLKRQNTFNLQYSIFNIQLQQVGQDFGKAPDLG
jgi:hypothetical protein